MTATQQTQQTPGSLSELMRMAFGDDYEDESRDHDDAYTQQPQAPVRQIPVMPRRWFPGPVAPQAPAQVPQNGWDPRPHPQRTATETVATPAPSPVSTVSARVTTIRGGIPGEGELFCVVPFEDRDEWLRIRDAGIGGSDAWIASGHEAFGRTPKKLWAEKTHRLAPEDLSENTAVLKGIEDEPKIRLWFSAQHPNYDVMAVDGILFSLARPHAYANVDGLFRDAQGAWHILEIKTARDWHKFDAGVPDNYRAQAYHYQAVTGIHTPVVFAVQAGETNHYREFEVPYDELAVTKQEQAIDWFWHECVERDKEPGVILAGDAKTETELHPLPTTSGFLDLSGSATAREAIEQWELAREYQSSGKDEVDQAAAVLQDLIGDYKGIVVDGVKITWSRSETMRLDTKKLKSEHADVYEECLVPTTRNGGLRKSGSFNQ